MSHLFHNSIQNWDTAMRFLFQMIIIIIFIIEWLLIQIICNGKYMIVSKSYAAIQYLVFPIETSAFCKIRHMYIDFNHLCRQLLVSSNCRIDGPLPEITIWIIWTVQPVDVIIYITIEVLLWNHCPSLLPTIQRQATSVHIVIWTVRPKS